MAIEIPAWFDFDTYMANKLTQLQKTEPDAKWTTKSLEEAFAANGFAGEEGAYKHFLQYGADEEVSPNADFDPEAYYISKAARFYNVNPSEVTESQVAAMEKAFDDNGLNAWTHYQLYGTAEGINPSNDFDTSSYMDAKLAQMRVDDPGYTMDDLVAAFETAGLSALEHYFLYGKDEGITATPVSGDEIIPDEPKPDPEPEHPGETYYLTADQDVMTGTANDDMFYADEIDGVNSLQSGDRIDGGAGIDTIQADVTAGSSYGHTLNTITPTLNSVEVVKFNARQSTDGVNADQAVAQIDAERISGMTELWNTNSRADLVVEDVRTDSNKLTIVMQDTDPTGVDFTVKFDAQHLKGEESQTTGTLVAQLIDTVGAANARAAGTSEEEGALRDNPYTGFHFKLNGKDYILDFGAYNADTDSDPSYAELAAQMQKAIDDNPELAGLGLTVTTGGAFSATVGIGLHQGDVVTGTKIVITSDQGVLEGGNWVAENGLPPTNSTSATFDDNTQSTCPLITTDVVLDNVGRVEWADAEPGCLPDDVIFGSNAGDLTIGSIADRGGVERFNVKVDEGSWLSALQSTNETLRMVTVEAKDLDGDGKSGGQLYIGDWEGAGDQLGNNNEWTWTDAAKLLTAHQDLANGDNAGLLDVAVFDAHDYAGQINIAAEITASSFDKYFKSVDGTSPIDDNYAPLGDIDYNGAFSYFTGEGNDVVNMTVNGAIAADNDFAMNIKTGNGDDLVAFRYADMTNTQSLNQKNLENVTIDTGDGDDTVWFYGDQGGSVNINTGAGNDVIYANQQEFFTGGNTRADLPASTDYNAVFVFNTTLSQIGVAGLEGATLSNDMAIGNDTFTLTGVTAGDVLNVTVTFKGYTADAVIANVTTGMTSVTAEQVNHAIMEAIANDPTLSALLVAKDGAGHTLLIESLINGEMTLNDLNISFGSTKADGKAGTTGLNTGSWYDTQFGTDNAGALYDGNDTTTSQVVVNGGAGDDVIVLGPNGGLMDIVKVGANNGNDSLVGFVSGEDKINLAGLGLTGTSLNAAAANSMVANGAAILAGAGADEKTGLYSQTAVDKLVTDKALGFAGGQANGSTGVVLLDSVVDDHHVYTIVQMTYNGTSTTAKVMGSLTMDMVNGTATEIAFGDLTLSDVLQSSVVTAAFGQADYNAIAGTTFDGSALFDTFDDLSTANLVNKSGAAITAVNGLGSDDTFNVTGDISSALALNGDAGNDVFNIGAATTSLTIDGGTGNDSLTVSTQAGNVAFTVLNNVENIALNNTGTATITSMDTDAATTLTAAATVTSLTIDALTATAATTIDGSLVTGAVAVDATASTAAVTLMGGKGNATLTGGDAADTLVTTGTGANTLTGGAGDDTITLGSTGVDTIVFGATLAANGHDTITGFEAGSGKDVLDVSAFATATGTLQSGNAASADITVDNTNNIGVLLNVADGLLDAAKVVTAGTAANGEVIIADGDHAVVLVTDEAALGAGDYNMYYVTGGATPTVELVGTITADAAFDIANFA